MLSRAHIVVIVYAAASLAALALYGWDKRAARLGHRRIPEARLHWVELAGGWPGALVGMWLFRHKRRKVSFWSVTALIAAAHVALWAWLLS